MPRSSVAKLLFLVPSLFDRAPVLGFLPLIWAFARPMSDISTILVRKGAENAYELRIFRRCTAACCWASLIRVRTRELDATASDAYAIIPRRSPVGPIQSLNRIEKGLGAYSCEAYLRC